MQDIPAVSLRFFCLIIDPEEKDPKASLMFLRASLLKGSKVERRKEGKVTGLTVRRVALRHVAPLCAAFHG